MPKETPAFFTPHRINELVRDVQDYVSRVQIVADTAAQDAISEIRVANSGAYDRLMLEIKRWSRSVEDGFSEARKSKAGKRAKK